MRTDESHNGINTQTGSSYTLALSDANGIVEMNNTSANTIIVPLDSSVNFTDKTCVTVVQFGTGQTTIQPAVGVTIHSAGDILTVPGEKKSVVLYRRGTNDWMLLGAGEATVELSAELLVTQAYCDLVEATEDERAALMAFTQSAVDSGWYDKLIMFNPLVGADTIAATIDLKRYQMLDPQDLDSAYRLTPSGTGLASAKGMNVNGDSADTINTHVLGETIAGAPQIGCSWYVQSPIRRLFSTPGFNINVYDGGSSYPSIGDNSTGKVYSGSNVGGLWFVQREDADHVKIYVEGVQKIDDDTMPGVTNLTGVGDILLKPLDGTFEVSMLAIHKEFTGAEITSYTTAVNALMSALGRDI